MMDREQKLRMMNQAARLAIWMERYDHQFISEWGFCKAEIHPDDQQMQAIYAAGLWGYTVAKEEG